MDELEPYETRIEDIEPEPVKEMEQATSNKQQAATPPQKGVMKSHELKGKKFTMMPVKGVWSDIMGKPSLPFYWMIYGKPGSGKSTMAILLAKFLANVMKMRVLYIAKEEGAGYTLQEKFDRLNAWSDNIDIADTIPADLKPYDVVFTDSVNELKLTADDVADMVNAGKKNGISYVLIYKATKAGQYKGVSENEHLVDISTVIEDGITFNNKNRFDGNGRMNVFDYAKQ